MSFPSFASWTRHRVTGVTRFVHVNVAESIYVPGVFTDLLAQYTDGMIGVDIFAIDQPLLKVPSVFMHPVPPPDERTP